jgi:Outer membrane receptor proteins, mostly Fe transport
MKKVFLFLMACILPLLSVFSEEFEYDYEADSLRWVSLQSVEVISTRATSTTPVAYSHINKEEIKNNNFGLDIPFLLTLTPSVIATSEAGAGIGYTGFRIRGTDANRINITSNGIPMNEAESHTVFWVNIPDFASSLEDLQIQRGVGTSTNGAGAFGASVNMKTENIPMQAYAEFNGSYGSFNTQKASVKAGTGLLNDRWAFDVRLSSITSDGFIDRASVDLKSYFAQGAYFYNNTILKLITFSGNEKTYHAWDGVPDYILAEGNRTYNPSGYMGKDENGKELFYENQTDNYKQTHYQLHLFQSFNPKLTLNAALHYTRGRGYYEEYKQERKLVEYGLKPFEYEGETIKKSDLVRQKHLDNHFGGGVFSLNYKDKKWDVALGGGGNYYDGGHFGRVIWVKNYMEDPAFYPDYEYYRSKGKKADMNLYLKGTYQLTAGLNLYADLQYRHIDYKIDGTNDVWDKINNKMQALDIHEKFDFFNPKAGVFYQINRENNVYGSVAVAHREPNRNNYTDADTNELPHAERLTDFELGYKFNNSRFLLGVNFYYMLYKDQLVLTGKVNEIGEALTSNVPDSYRMGAELLLGAKITEWLQWNGNLTLSENKIKDYTEYIMVDDGASPQKEEYYATTTISYSPSVIANSLFSFNYKGILAGLQSSYVSKQYLDNTARNDRSIDPYFVNNLRLGYTFTKIRGVKELGINLLINNLFNEQYEVNGWTWTGYYTQNDGSLASYTETSYFPQAGTNVLVNVAVKF